MTIKSRNIPCHIWRSIVGLLFVAGILATPVHAALAANIRNANQPLPTSSEGFYYFFEADEPINIENILYGQHPKWQYSEVNFINALYKNDAVWLRIEMPHVVRKNEQRLLELSSPFLDNIELYHIRYDDNSIPFLFSLLRDGDEIAPSNRPLKARSPLFKINLEKNVKSSVYIRIKTTSAIRAGVRLWKPAEYIVSEQNFLIFHSIFFGIMLSMAIYNLINAVFLRDITYLYYVVYVVSIVGYVLALSGLGGRYFWGDVDFISKNGFTLSVNLSFLFGGVFIARFLSLEREARRLYSVARVFITFFSMMAIIGLFMAESILVPLLLPTGMAACAFVLWSGLYQWKRGNHSARCLIWAWSFLMFGTIIFILMLLNVLPQNPFTEYIQVVGFAVEATLLSLALASRLSHEKYAKQLAIQTSLNLARQVNKANQEKIDIQQQANQELECKVEERTRELVHTLTDLQKANEKLAQLSMTDGLTGISNRRYFDESLEKELRRAERNGHPLSLILLDIDHFKQLNDVHGHLAGDECLRQFAQLLRSMLPRATDLVTRYGGEEFAVILPNTHQESAIHVAEKLRHAIEKMRIKFEGKVISITTSLGVVSIKTGILIAGKNVLNAADNALYEAKKSGRNRWMVGNVAG